MIFKKSSKLIAAVLTAALALSPVFVTPISATDGQEVESQASSWRYQDGDIVAEETVSAFEADDPQMLEDYNAQMGSSMEEPAADVEEAPVVEVPYEEVFEEPAEEITEEPAEEVTEEPAAVEEPVEEITDGTEPEETVEPAEELAEEPVEETEETVEPTEPAAEMTEPEAEPTEPVTEMTEPVTEPETATEETVQAEEVEMVQVEEPLQAEEPEISAKSATVSNRYWSWSNGKYKRGPGYLKGIDVSVWQGEIDWARVKKAGVDFAIIRCGYGANKSSKDDSKFAANVKGCVKNGIPYGVYIYSYANTVTEAKDEADHALRLLRKNKCKISYPVYYDLEDSQVNKASNKTIRKMAAAFCSKLEANGYPAGVYANLSWWNRQLSGFSGYDRWVAQWDSKCSYKGSYSIWQCTSRTKVRGISGRVDANLLMCPKASIDQYMAQRRAGKPVAASAPKTTVQKKVYKNQFVKIGAYMYAFDAKGAKVKGKKHWIGYKAYILDSQGRAYINKSKTKKRAKYYAKPGKVKKGTLKKGKKFYVIRTKGKWSQMANGYWIKTSLTKKTSLYPIIRPSVEVKYKAKLKKKTTSRSGPSNKYIKKKKFKKNKTVTVIGTYGSWSKISTGQWLPSKRLKKK